MMEDRLDDARLLVRSNSKMLFGYRHLISSNFLKVDVCMYVCVYRCHAIVVFRDSSYMSCHQDKSNGPCILAVVCPALSPSLLSFAYLVCRI